ncbi:CbtA family protein [Blastococcus mobilis]|uniref:Probable cobalt transporter subunit (CbtA) n=1 Tax=Blastococcus mobilis TaxID=1938746 RepID=A0A238ZH88_9ACTN|nr:CbtA family protein [Blastococcus mobilis]SNR82024.1 Probable cobalt transporter subunit (CbtA) [Blastococcus mobilis]
MTSAADDRLPLPPVQLPKGRELQRRRHGDAGVALVSLLRSRGVSVAGTATAATAATAVLLALVLVFLPGSPDTIPGDVPATVVWNFRLASLGQPAVLWAALGLVGGWLVDRLAGSR